jgi:membrane protein YdbS with pleckstrin-like domain
LEPTSPEAQAELTRRHKAAATTVIGLLVATILLCVVAFLGRPYFQQQPNPPLDVAVRILILVLGLGAVVWRRTKFQPMRLQDIAGLAGVSGLLRTLEKTTIQIALLGAAVTAVGFVSTLLTGNDWYTYWSSAIAVILYIYCYPTKSSWLRALYRFTERQPAPETPAAS